MAARLYPADGGEWANRRVTSPAASHQIVLFDGGLHPVRLCVAETQRGFAVPGQTERLDIQKHGHTVLPTPKEPRRIDHRAKRQRVRRTHEAEDRQGGRPTRK